MIKNSISDRNPILNILKMETRFGYVFPKAGITEEDCFNQREHSRALSVLRSDGPRKVITTRVGDSVMQSINKTIFQEDRADSSCVPQLLPLLDWVRFSSRQKTIHFTAWRQLHEQKFVYCSFGNPTYYKDRSVRASHSIQETIDYQTWLVHKLTVETEVVIYPFIVV